MLIWGKRWLLPRAPVLQRQETLRLVREAFGIGGIVVSETGEVRRTALNGDHHLARQWVGALQALSDTEQLAVNLDQTYGVC